MHRLLRSPAVTAAAAGSLSLLLPVARTEAAVDAKPSFSERAVGNYENRLRRFSSPERVFEYFSSVQIERQFFMTRDDLARAVTPYTYRRGAPLASKNPKFNAKASAAKLPQDVADEYQRRVQRLLLDDAGATRTDVEQLLAFRDEHHVDFETHVKTLRALQITNAEFDQFVETFFDMVDADGDGLISYPEYMFFNTLLASKEWWRGVVVVVELTLCWAVPERQFELAFKMFDTDDNGMLDHREFKQVK
ncbi:unnamed protein product [Phytophthora lilii]|uniref:Unnamed protein product n=1 Tax=Phytophthora lilii TaxID=2077276 RepID=A0A9W6YIS5_9STRA|nr:unnamed protein product [Phytophthora lilii]